MGWATTRKQLSTPTTHPHPPLHPDKSWMHRGQSGKFCSLIIQREMQLARPKLAHRRPRTEKMSSFGLRSLHTRIMDWYIMQRPSWPMAVILGCVGGDLHPEKSPGCILSLPQWAHNGDPVTNSWCSQHEKRRKNREQGNLNTLKASSPHYWMKASKSWKKWGERASESWSIKNT